MKLKKQFLVLLFLFTSAAFTNAQTFKLFGELKPGSLVVGVGKNISEVKLDDKKIQVDNSGTFIFGFDRDAEGVHLLEVIFSNGKPETKKITLPKRKYEIQKLRISSKYVEPPADQLEKLEREAEIMKETRTKVGIQDSALFNNGFVYPVDNPRITSVFGSQRILNGVKKNPHNGIDFGADEGTPVYSTTNGTVLIAGDNFYYNGNFVLIDHGQGLTSVYLHLSKLNVKTGDRVKKGQKIGEVGSTGRSTSAHLHWGVQWYGKRVDPLSLFKINF